MGAEPLTDLDAMTVAELEDPKFAAAYVRAVKRNGAQAFDRGYRKAIADLRDEATRSAGATTGAAVDRTPGDFKRARAYYSGLDHAADFLESRLTKEQP